MSLFKGPEQSDPDDGPEAVAFDAHLRRLDQPQIPVHRTVFRDDMPPVLSAEMALGSAERDWLNNLPPGKKEAWQDLMREVRLKMQRLAQQSLSGVAE